MATKASGLTNGTEALLSAEMRAKEALIGKVHSLEMDLADAKRQKQEVDIKLSLAEANKLTAVAEAEVRVMRTFMQRCDIPNSAQQSRESDH